MSAPERGRQLLVGPMGWVLARPALVAVEVAWRWIFGVPFLAVYWMEARRVLAALPPEAAGLGTIDPQNPWVAAAQLSHAWALYRPLVDSVFHGLLPASAVAWVALSGVGRGLLLKRMEPGLRFRPLGMMALQAAWLAAFALTCWGWLGAMQWVAATHILPNTEPDLVGYAIWAIFLTLGFITAWALGSWAFTMAPLLMLREGRGPLSALRRSCRLGWAVTGKLAEINLVMGIIKLALIVLAMVFSAAPLPFSDELGGGALHVVWGASTAFYLVANDYFQVVRLKGFVEFWRSYRGSVA